MHSFLCRCYCMSQSILRKGVTFQWMEQCNNAFKLLKSELVKMTTLQYPNQNELFKLFTDASRHSYSGILHQDETSKTPNAEANLIPITYFSGSFCRTQQLWNTTQKECYVVYQSIQKFAFYLTGVKWPQAISTILHYRYVQSCTRQMGFGTSTVQH